MLSDVECCSLAEEYLLRLAQQWGEEFLLMPSPFETSATFAYTYNRPEFLATGNYIYALGGNAPIMVSKLTGDPRCQNGCRSNRFGRLGGDYWSKDWHDTDKSSRTGQ